MKLYDRLKASQARRNWLGVLDKGRSPPKARVRYNGASDAQVAWGDCSDPRGVLVEGDVYELESSHVYNWHTKYHLDGFEGGFNSLCFEGVTP